MRRTYINQALQEALQEALQGNFPALEIAAAPNPAIVISADNLLDFLAFVRKEDGYDFDRLGSLTAVDYPEHFEMVYHLHSRALGHALTVKTRLGKNAPVVDSVTDIWRSADFQEREVYDLMGIEFKGHPDLRRILLPDDFAGYPLRKDFKPEARC